MSERRLLPRVAQNQPVRISLLHPQPPDASGEQVFTGTCMDISLAGACLRLDRELTPGTLVRVESGDSLWLGEVVHCHADGDGFLAGMHFEHSVIGLGQLVRTLQRLDWSPSSDVPAGGTAPSSRRV